MHPPDLTTVTDALAEALFTVRLPDRVIEYANRTAEEMFGIPASELVGAPTTVLYPSEESAGEFGAKLAGALADNQPQLRTEHVFVRRGGGEFWGAVSTTFLFRDGKARRVISVVTDISERKRIEQALELSERRRSEEKALMAESLRERQKLDSLGILAGGIAHDFNNILGVVTLNIDMLRRMMEPDSKLRHRLEVIAEATDRAADLTRQLLAYAGQGRLLVERVDLSALITSMETLLRLSISPRAALTLQLRAVPAIEADATQLRQVIMNLVINASQALVDKRGGVELEVYERRLELEPLPERQGVAKQVLEPGRYVVLEVRDEGQGIAADHLERIFEPFFTTKEKGHGLGLSAILGIVKSHRGGIKVESTPGQGSRFRVFFPAVDGQAVVYTSSGSDVSTWRGHGRALVVDDEPVLRLATREMLEELGFEVVEARHGGEALERLHDGAQRYTFVLLDLTMPVMDGLEALERMRELGIDVPVILASGYRKHELTERHKHAGFSAFVHKPYVVEELIAAVRAVVEPGSN